MTWADGPEVASPRAGRRETPALTLLRMTVGVFVAAATPVLAHSGAAAHDLADAGHGLAAGFVRPSGLALLLG